MDNYAVIFTYDVNKKQMKYNTKVLSESQFNN
jgi:hypothetical protein